MCCLNFDREVVLSRLGNVKKIDWLMNLDRKVHPAYVLLESWYNLAIRSFLRGQNRKFYTKPTDDAIIFAYLKTRETSGIDQWIKLIKKGTKTIGIDGIWTWVCQKISKSQKQIMMFLILPQNDVFRSFFGRIWDFIICFHIYWPLTTTPMHAEMIFLL